MSRATLIGRFLVISVLFLLAVASLPAQTTRPRRAARQPQKSTASNDKPAADPLLRPEPTATPTRKTSPNDPLLTVQPVSPVANSVASANTQSAYALLEQKQFAAAAKEAKEMAAQHPNDPEAWKIAGFAELNLKQYAEAAKDLEKAVTLQRQTKQTDPNTESALGQAYVLSENYQ